ncbi:MAG TPA: flagellar FlbD family protein [Desulfuromonadales bacterium]|nr:flagellar FlbD family protein [Desulfuromonadales bacterium]
MIVLTARDGDQILFNPDQIETIEETPDTHLTLINGHHYLVMEKAAEVVDKIIDFKAQVLRRAWPEPSTPTPRRARSSTRRSSRGAP